MQTETIDKLFLELSQVSKAKTAREIQLLALLERLVDQAENLGRAIERCGASHDLTTASLMASRIAAWCRDGIEGKPFNPSADGKGGEG